MTAEEYELLSAYIDNMLTDRERSALEARLQTENTLRDELDALRSTIALVKSLPTLKAPRNFTLTPEMVGLATKPRRKVLPFPTMALASAAASFLLIALGMLLLLGDSDNLTMDRASEPIVAMPPSDAIEQPQSSEPEVGLYSNITPADMDDGADAEGISPPGVPMPEPEEEAEESDMTLDRSSESSPPVMDQAVIEEEAGEAFFEAEAATGLSVDEQPAPANIVPRPQSGGSGGLGSGGGDDLKDAENVNPPPLPDQEMMGRIELQATQTAMLNMPVEDVARQTEARAAATESDNTPLALILLAGGAVLLVISGVMIYRWRAAH